MKFSPKILHKKPRLSSDLASLLALLLSVWAISPASALEVIAGTGEAGFSGEGEAAIAAKLNRPQAVAQGAEGTLYIADAGNRRVRRITVEGRIRTVAGTGGVGSPPLNDSPDGLSVPIAFPFALAMRENGDLLMADGEGQRLFSMSREGNVRVLAGTGNEEAASFGGVPPSPLLYPSGLLADADGAFVSEMGSGRLLRFSEEGAVSLLAEGFVSPYGIARDVDDGILVADYGRGTVYRVKDGLTTTVATLPGATPEDPLPVNPPLPSSVALGSDGSLYIAAPDVGMVYRLSANGQITPFLTRPALSRPTGLFVTLDSRLLIADEGRHQILSEPLPFPAPLPGDADGNNRVNVTDALLGLRYLVGDRPFERRQFLALDDAPAATGSGRAGDRRLTIQDVVRILRKAVGLAD